MSRGRLWLVNTAIALFLIGSFYVIIIDQDSWPFCAYQMYSQFREGRSLIRPRLFGVTAEEPSREIPLLKRQYIQPFDQSRLAKAFMKMQGLPNHDQLFKEALRDCLVRYEALRRLGRHNGPPLKGIRLYELHWQLDPWARNRDNPDQRILLAEVT